MLVMITDRPPVLQLCSINSNGNLYNSDEHAAEHGCFTGSVMDWQQSLQHRTSTQRWCTPEEWEDTKLDTHRCIVIPDIHSDCSKTLELLANWPLPITTWEFQGETHHHLPELTASHVFIMMHNTFYYHLLEVLCKVSDMITTVRYDNTQNWVDASTGRRRSYTWASFLLFVEIVNIFLNKSAMFKFKFMIWPYQFRTPYTVRSESNIQTICLFTTRFKRKNTSY